MPPTELGALGAGAPVVVDFWAEWCAPCAAYSPVVEEVMASRGDAAILLKVDIVDEPELASVCGVSSVPAVAVVKDGVGVRRIFGARPAAQLAELLDRAIGGSPPSP